MFSKLFLTVFLFFSALLFFVSCKDGPTEPIDKKETNPFAAIDPSAFANTYVIKDVNLISMSNEIVLENQDVKIENGIIVEIGSVDDSNLPDSVLINGTGKYLIPGLNDMHIHLAGNNPNQLNDLFLYLANGVTSVRVVWGFQSIVRTRDEINSGESFGPKMYVAGPGLEGTNPYRGGIEFSTLSEVKEIVKEITEADFDFIKVYDGVPNELYLPIIKESKENDIVPIGHLPNNLDPFIQIRNPLASLEHLMIFRWSAVSNRNFYTGSLDEQALKQALDSSMKYPTFYTPTSTILATGSAYVDTKEQSPELAYVSPAMKRIFTNTASIFPETGVENARKNVDKIVSEIIKTPLKSKILSGVDSGFGYFIPGFTLHDELKSLVRAGMTPYEALRSSTVIPSEFYGTQNETGTIEEGKRADLVLLNSNPLFDIANTKDIAGVMVYGKWISKDFIDKRLLEISDFYRH